MRGGGEVGFFFKDLKSERDWLDSDAVVGKERLGLAARLKEASSAG